MTKDIGLPDRLRERRERDDISISEAARRLDCARHAYRLWEAGVSRPDPTRWVDVCAFAEMPLPTYLRQLGLLSREQEDLLLAQAKTDSDCNV